MGESRLIKIGDPGYPDKISRFVTDRKDLFYRGNLAIAETLCIGIVGARKCTPYGMAVAKGLAKRAAELGVSVVSGLAMGIDSAAHIGALEGGGMTIAVLATGTDIYYPKSNRKLQYRIEDEGLMLSEYPDGTKAMPFSFPIRNRLIAALSDAVVIVECETKSGSLITAECAAEMGKKVYGVPGNITSPMSLGPNKLIREGAEPLVFFDDVFTALGLRPSAKEAVDANLGEDEKKVLSAVKASGELSFDEISRATGLPISEIGGIATVLEMKELVFCEFGKVCAFTPAM